MNATITGVIKTVLQPEVIINRQTNMAVAVEYKFLVEENDGSQYPDSMVLKIYDKSGINPQNGQALPWNQSQKVAQTFKDWQGFNGNVTEGMWGTFSFHTRGVAGISNNTGKPYGINEISCWKAVQGTAAQTNTQQPQWGAIPTPQQFQQQGVQQPFQQQPFSQPAQGQVSPAGGFNAPNSFGGQF